MKVAKVQTVLPYYGGCLVNVLYVPYSIGEGIKVRRYIVEAYNYTLETMVTIGEYESKEIAIEEAIAQSVNGRPVQITDTEYQRSDGSVGPNIIYEDNC